MASGMTPDTAPEPIHRSVWQKWVEFWFPASDPTTLGFIRITTGLLVLYIHLAYSVDLQQFFGSTGWYAHRFVERERHEFPWQVTPFFEWNPQETFSAKVPDYPHRRKAVVDFIRNLPEDEAKRKDSLRFLERLAKMDNPTTPVVVLNWVQKMGVSEQERERFLATLIAGPPTDTPNRETLYYIRETPYVLFSLPQTEREQLAAEVRSFWTILPKNSTEASAHDREYVLEHLSEVPPEIRKSFVDFLVNLPADAAKRKQTIDYLDYWNNEQDKCIRSGHMVFSVWFHVTDPTQMAIIHICILLIMVMFTLGLFSRVTSVLVWIAVVGYIHRSQQVLFGMDTMMNILLFYLMIGNCGGALSLDRLIARYRAARASLARTGTLDAPTQAFLAWAPPSKSAGFALRLIQIHFCFIYIAAGLSKLKGAAWWDGRATWDVFVNPEFTLIQYEWYENALRSFVKIKPFYYGMTIFGSWFTLFIEIAGPFLLWTRVRWLIIFLASAMHAMIAVMMGLNLFELLMVVMVLAFVPDGVIRDRLRGGANLVKLAFAFNPASTVSARAAALAVATDTDAQVSLVPESSLVTPTVTNPEGKKLSGTDGVSTLFRSVRLLAPFRFVLWIPGVSGLFARFLFPAPKPPIAPPPVTRPPAPAAAS